MTRLSALLAAAALLGGCGDRLVAQEALPAGAKVIKLEARPASLNLTRPFAYAQLVVSATLDTGDVVDVTRLAAFEVPNAIRVSPTGFVRIASNGTGDLRIKVADQTLTVPVSITGQTDNFAASFVRDVMPLVSKLGCNAGTCHGSAEGKNGFKLSLRGYDPLFDHRALTDDLEGRRFNRAAPERSLMLMKPAGAVPHRRRRRFAARRPELRTGSSRGSRQGVKLDLDAPRVRSPRHLPARTDRPQGRPKAAIPVSRLTAMARPAT